DKFYTTPSGMVGSLGAYTVHEDRSAANAQQGRRFTYVSAGQFKTEGNPDEPLSASAIEYRQEIIDELYEQFVDAVAQGRGVTSDFAKANFGEGRMLSANSALQVGLVDGVLSYEQLIGEMSNRPSQVNINGQTYNAIFNKQTGGFTFTSITNATESRPLIV